MRRTDRAMIQRLDSKCQTARSPKLPVIMLIMPTIILRVAATPKIGSAAFEPLEARKIATKAKKITSKE